MRLLNFCFFFILGLMCCNNGSVTKNMQTSQKSGVNYNQLSQDLLEAIKQKANTKNITDQLASVSSDELAAALQTDDEKLAFWVNIYNAYIILILQDNPDLYKDRGSFFKKEQVHIAGEVLSFDKIEHGFIRNSTLKLSKGYIRALFPGKLEKKFRVENKDPRIHFTLNCGAKDCPPVYVYQPATLEEDFDQVASTYLNRVSEYDESKQVVKTTPLFNWFTGDWGGKDGVKDMLYKYKIIPKDHDNIDLEWKDYDWTLDIDNFGE